MRFAGSIWTRWPPTRLRASAISSAEGTAPARRAKPQACHSGPAVMS
ncbi:MAG: hypothetical protein ABSF26_07040 [Thermoguttaceae bacterium]